MQKKVIERNVDVNVIMPYSKAPLWGGLGLWDNQAERQEAHTSKHDRYYTMALAEMP